MRCTCNSGCSVQNTSESLHEHIKALDVEGTELVKNTIEMIKPGKPLGLSILCEINNFESKKNRLIVARFASLLKKRQRSARLCSLDYRTRAIFIWF